MKGLLKVSQLTSRQRDHYTEIFKLYSSLNIKVAPNSFTLNTKDGFARVKFEIIDLLDSKGSTVVTSASWTRIEIEIAKQNDLWLKVAVYKFN